MGVGLSFRSVDQDMGRVDRLDARGRLRHVGDSDIAACLIRSHSKLIVSVSAAGDKSHTDILCAFTRAFAKGENSILDGAVRNAERMFAPSTTSKSAEHQLVLVS